MTLYTERIMQHTAIGDWNWYVPDGKRVVLRCITAVNTVGAAGRCMIVGGVIALYYSIVPASSAITPVDLRCVLYAGERLTMHIYDQDISVGITGYVFSDPSGSRGVRSGPGPELGEPLPAPALSP